MSREGIASSDTLARFAIKKKKEKEKKESMGGLIGYFDTHASHCQKGKKERKSSGENKTKETYYRSKRNLPYVSI